MPYARYLLLGMLLAAAACAMPQTGSNVDWSGMNYVGQDCGENATGAFTNPQCRAKKPDDLTVLNPPPGHR